MSPERDDFVAWMVEIQARTESALERRLPSAAIVPQSLHEAMRYATLGGGKRVRALLVHAAGELVDASPERLDVVASAVELIHAYSLVHDDMPCMDDDGLRRGKPTVHVQYGEATALLAGDALQTLAFQVLAEATIGDPAIQLDMLRQLALASGSRGMAGGQAIDLDSVGKQISLESLELMHIHKTGALIRAATVLGACCGGPLPSASRDAIDRYGKLIGLLFQVIDDILDEQADTATLGKTAGKDAAHDKPTYVSLLGLSEARALADRLLASALAAIAPLGPTTRRLEGLARFIVSRKF